MKSMNLKKLFAMMMVLVMVLGCFAGCGGGSEEESGGTEVAGDQSLQSVLDSGKLHVAVSPDYAPYEYLDLLTGEIKGSDIEFAKHIGEELGVEIVFEQMSFESCLAAVNTGSVDLMISCMGYSVTGAPIPTKVNAISFHINPHGFANGLTFEEYAEMAKEAEESVEDANKLLQKYDKELVRKVRESEDLVDIYEDRIGTYLVKLAGKNLSEADSRIVSELLHCIGDIERISDHAAGITKAVEELHEKQIAFSDSAQKELHVIANAVGEVMSLATTSFLTEDLEMAKRVEPLEQVIDRLKSKIKANHIVRLQQGNCSIEMGFILNYWLKHR